MDLETAISRIPFMKGVPVIKQQNELLHAIDDFLEKI
jgi:hypothetical protein